MFSNVYEGKTVFITGHTGFKGSWLSTWLLKLGARVVGFSIDVPTEPSMFEIMKLKKNLIDLRGDIRDLSSISKALTDHKPDYVFHLAAQPIVSKSFQDPIETFSTNVIGTANVLEALRELNHHCIAILITSDKCYENVEQLWGYKETDRLGGLDPYSASKGAAELVISSYVRSFMMAQDSNVRVAVGRAGNVIGGGDWAKDRIVVDAYNSWHKGTPLCIRSPDATRPWQHVLEPLSGYLDLGRALSIDNGCLGEAFNFGPSSSQVRTVRDLIDGLAQQSKGLGEVITEFVPQEAFHEAGLLKLNCEKAEQYLNWRATLTFNETLRFVSVWYTGFYAVDSKVKGLAEKQIAEYEQLAAKRGVAWSLT